METQCVQRHSQQRRLAACVYHESGSFQSALGSSVTLGRNRDSSQVSPISLYLRPTSIRNTCINVCMYVCMYINGEGIWNFCCCFSLYSKNQKKIIGDTAVCMYVCIYMYVCWVCMCTLRQTCLSSLLLRFIHIHPSALIGLHMFNQPNLNINMAISLLVKSFLFFREWPPPPQQQVVQWEQY